MKRDNKEKVDVIVSTLTALENRLKDVVKVEFTKSNHISKTTAQGMLLSDNYYETFRTVNKIANLLITDSIKLEISRLESELSEL